MSAPEDPELTAAFVARLWPDVRGLRTRVRHTIDVRIPEIEATARGTSEQVVSDLIGWFSSWANDFADAAHPPEPPEPDEQTPTDRDPMTPR